MPRQVLDKSLVEPLLKLKIRVVQMKSSLVSILHFPGNCQVSGLEKMASMLKVSGSKFAISSSSTSRFSRSMEPTVLAIATGTDSPAVRFGTSMREIRVS